MPSQRIHLLQSSYLRDGMGRAIHHRVGVPFLAQHGWKMDLDAWFNKTEVQRGVSDIIGNYAQQADA